MRRAIIWIMCWVLFLTSVREAKSDEPLPSEQVNASHTFTLYVRGDEGKFIAIYASAKQIQDLYKLDKSLKPPRVKLIERAEGDWVWVLNIDYPKLLELRRLQKDG